MVGTLAPHISSTSIKAESAPNLSVKNSHRTSKLAEKIEKSTQGQNNHNARGSPRYDASQ